jgi:hypothetical protein
MTGHPSSPFLAALGLVVTAADGLRRLPRALGSAGQAAYRRYDELAVRGRDVLAGRTPPAPGDAPGHAPGDEVGDELGDAAARDPDAGRPSGPAQPSGAAIAAATAPGSGVEPAAPAIGRSEPVVLPDDVQDEVAQLTAGADLRHDELPLEDFDHQTVPELRGRLRTLGLAELVQLRDYEQAHGARLPVLTLLDNRIAKLLADTGR